MPIKYIEGDLFDFVKKTDKSVVICHVCNDRGGWGSGFVVPLGQYFPEAKESYLEIKEFKRGVTQFVSTQQPNVTVANMVAQTLGGPRPLYYNDLARCMDQVAEFVITNNCKIIAPMFSSGLAGGDWNFTEKLVEDCWSRKELDVTICYLSNALPVNWSPPIGSSK